MLIWSALDIQLQTLGQTIVDAVVQAFFATMWFTVTIFLAYYVMRMFQLHQQQKITV